ncbi:hypothetical protein D0S45_09310 [Marinifilum sp. JC120]|nr:hypothetical protein D0S45_09310 [Marinifilum sp. JC120]
MKREHARLYLLKNGTYTPFFVKNVRIMPKNKTLKGRIFRLLQIQHILYFLTAKRLLIFSAMC